MADDSNDALERARRLLDQKPAKPPTSHKTKNRFDDTLETAKAFNENVSWLRRTGDRLQAIGRKIGDFFAAVWHHSGPIRLAIGPIARFIGRNYMRFYRRAAYRTHPETGARVFSRKRAAIVILLTASLPVIIYYTARPVAVTAQQAMMAVIAEKEAYTYFHGSETIEEGQLYTIKTTSQVPATPESTMHMHVQPDLIYWIWYPEDLANAVPNEVAWGRVKYTGWRMKMMGWFPEVKDIEAIPLSELPENHPAKSGHYHLSNEQLQQAARDGVTLPGTDLNNALRFEN